MLLEIIAERKLKIERAALDLMTGECRGVAGDDEKLKRSEKNKNRAQTKITKQLRSPE